jgi:ubiquinone/menaquinone biosynthesis C-methylase UbiE
MLSENEKSDKNYIDIPKLETEYVVDAYKPIAMTFNKTRRTPWIWQQKFIDEYIKDSYYIDIGCGGGRLLNQRSVGIDSCQEFINIVIQKGLNAVLADMTFIPFEDETFDNIMCIASYHHLSTQERRHKAMKEMFRVLKPGGHILISVWSIKQPKDTDTKKKFEKYGDVYVPWKNSKQKIITNRYYYIFQTDELEKMFYDNGFEIIEHIWDYGNEIYILQKK